MPLDNISPQGSKTRRWFVVATAIATLGGVLVAFNAFFGLNLRPAWGYEIEKIQKAQTELVAGDMKIQQQIEQVQQSVQLPFKQIHELQRGQLDLRQHQIRGDQRELRRELARQRQSEQEYRTKGTPVPRWLSDAISDTEHQIEELDGEKRQVQERLIRLRE